MKSLVTYDPPMCCSTGICGPSVDPILPQYAALLAELARQGVVVDRFNLGQQPMAFVQNATVKSLLEGEGVEVLPVLLLDGAVHLKGRYPDAAERDALRAMAGLAPAGAVA